MTSGKWRVTSSLLTTHHSPRITPFGEPSTGEADEQLIPDDPDERLVYARRIVAQRCLYGVDINPLAVEMAKLSLWLLTLAKDKPFTFLDHCIRCGDSLVGISSIDQLERFSLNGGGPQRSFAHEQIRRRIDVAKLLRQQLERMPSNTVHDIERKTQMLERADEQSGRLRYAADRMLAVQWKPMSDLEREQELQDTLIDVEFKFKDVPVTQLAVEANDILGRAACPRPFHWPLEFPEVFNQTGFDAFVCNPPFLGGQKITGQFGIQYRDYLIHCLANGKKGSADLCSYFFLRSGRLLGLNGNIGMISTNTIGQGDTREVGLGQLTSSGFDVFRATPSKVWPGNAAVFVAVCHLHKGEWSGRSFLNDQSVEHISSLLDSEVRVGEPQRLVMNADLSFMGTQVHGAGFVLTHDEADSLVTENERNQQVVKPYLDGATVNRAFNQAADKWVIDFSGMTQHEASQFDDCFDIVVKKVKPQRLELANRNASGRARAKTWWKFSREVKELYDVIRGRERVLVIARVSKTCAFVYVTPDQVLNEKLIVFTISGDWAFPVLQSSLHVEWCWTYSSTLKGDLNYSQTDCFETFPFPDTTTGLGECGNRYHGFRAEIMSDRSEGLTKTYNRFHNSDESPSDIERLRKLHVEMDQAVAAAYGWDDLDLGHDFHETKQGVRYTISESARREVLQRLLKLNHERYEEEVKQGLHDKKKKAKKKATPKKAAKKAPKRPVRTLFDMGDNE